MIVIRYTGLRLGHRQVGVGEVECKQLEHNKLFLSKFHLISLFHSEAQSFLFPAPKTAYFLTFWSFSLRRDGDCDPWRGDQCDHIDSLPGSHLEGLHIFFNA